MTMHKLITIVIPCKNEEKYIGNLLRDLTKQRLGNTRILVADANSTDGTLEIVRRYMNTNSVTGLNIEIIEGGPVSVARNNGAKLATTPFILFIDADVRFFDEFAIQDAVYTMVNDDLDLVTLNVKNYGTDVRASLLFAGFNVINKIMTKTTPFAIGAFFLTRRSEFEYFGGFMNKYDTSEDYILSKKYDPNRFKIVDHYFGQDERRFKKLGYIGMLWYMTKNFFNRNNLEHFEKPNTKYWD